MVRNFDAKIKKAKNKWTREFSYSLEHSLSNALVLENLRRTLRPLRHYRNFLGWAKISSRTATRLVLIGKREIDSNIISKNFTKLPDSYLTIEILLRLPDEKIRKLIRENKIRKSITRRDAHILADGKDAVKEQGLKPQFENTSPFQDIRIDSNYDDEKRMISLLKELVKIKNKYPFIRFNDRGYVDRIQRQIKKKIEDAERKKKEKLTKKEMKQVDKDLERLFGKKKKLLKGEYKDFKL
jgi:hypothetical protein|tara:strand:+ start:105 stop:824 length:720 start_codon:yes stop_codon:yes gene_type:complete